MTEKHINFDLSKISNIAADIDQVNERNIICKFCNVIIIWQGNAIKKTHQVNLIKNNMKEFEPMNTYWYVNDLKKFNNIMIHQLTGDIKYLSCLSC
jgi:hypothetical protein